MKAALLPHSPLRSAPARVAVSKILRLPLEPLSRRWISRATRFACLASLGLWSGAALAEPRAVSGARIELSEVVPNAPEAMAAIDLGESPAPGQTRLLTQSLLTEAIQRAGFSSAGLDLPVSVRVQRQAEQWSALELAKRARPALERSLRPGVRLQEVSARLPLTVALGSQVGEAHWNELPHRMGLVRATAMLEILDQDAVSKRIALTATLYIDEQGARHDVRRGDGVTLSITQKSAVISALAEAMADGDVGDTLSFRIKRTGKLLRAVLETPRTARVLPTE